MNGMLPLAFLFGAGLDEWALLGAVAFLLFGPRRLPEISRWIGRTVGRLRQAASEFRTQIEQLDEPAGSGSDTRPPFSNPPPGAVDAAGWKRTADVAPAAAPPAPAPAPANPVKPDASPGREAARE